VAARPARRRKERREVPRDGKRGDDDMEVTCKLSFLWVRKLKTLYRILAGKVKMVGLAVENSGGLGET
jgi:hypothetical protein